nr:MAG TPA: upper collar protein [Caudoviricetes sp.]
MGRRKTYFDESAILNNRTYVQYVNRLTELAISMFEWSGLPESVDSRYIELHLFSNGCMVYFDDEVMGNLCLDCTYNGGLDVYGYPILRRAYSSYNGYNRLLKNSNSVIIWNNLLHIPSEADIRAYARRLWMLDRIIDVNANAQKTPILVQGNEKQRLSLVNLYKEYDGNAPVIFGDSSLNTEGLKSISTGAPYVADRIYELKTQIWNEALTYLGISNINIQKKERLITDEVTRNQGGTVASRYSRLEARRQAVERINDMFGTNIKVNYREDYQEIEPEDVFNNEENGGDSDE